MFGSGTLSLGTGFVVRISSRLVKPSDLSYNAFGEPHRSNPNSLKGSDFFISGKGVYLNILKNMVLHFKSSFGTIYRKT